MGGKNTKKRIKKKIYLIGDMNMVWLINIFNKKELQLACGCIEIINPIDILEALPKKANNRIIMKARLNALLGCDAVYLLGHWWESDNAEVEYVLARNAAGIEILGGPSGPSGPGRHRHREPSVGVRNEMN